MQQLICFDPGPTCGVAVFRDGVLREARALSLNDSYYYLIATFPLLTSNPSAVIVESYLGRYLTTEAAQVLKLIGMIELSTRLHLGVHPVYQRAQARRSFLDQATTTLRELDPTARWTQHHKDATAHGLYFLYTQQEEHSRDDPTPREA